MYRASFVKEFKQLINESGVRQKTLADAIDVSGAAISQFMRGINLPTFRHMDIIFSLLKTPADRAFYIKNLLAYARSDSKDGKFTAFNRNLLTMRHNSGYSLPRLSGRTGIPVGRLSALESDPDCVPTQDELARLKDFFGCTPEEFANFNVLSGASRLAEHNNFGIPRINHEDLIKYQADIPLAEYAHRVLRDFVPRKFDGFADPVILEIKSELLGFPFTGTLQLTLTSRQPFGFIPMTLSRYPGNVFRLEQSTPNRTENRDGALWSFPVTELQFLPIQPTEA